MAAPFREISYTGLAMWGTVLLYFLFWKTVGRYYLKRPIRIPVEIGLERKDEFLAQQRTILTKAANGFRRALFGSGFAIIVCSFFMLTIGVNGLDDRKAFILQSLILVTCFVPAFFLLLLISAFMNDYLKMLAENECILRDAPQGGEPQKIWLLNLLPLLALVFLYQGGAELVGRLGYGTGLAMVVVVLSLVFLGRKESVGICLNLILLGFIFISYLAPQFDQGQGGAFILAFQVLPLLAIIFGTMFLARYPLFNRLGVFAPQMTGIISYFTKIPILVGVLTPVLWIPIQGWNILPYSLMLVGSQALAWLGVWLSLSWAGRQGKLDLPAIRNYIRKEKHYILPFDRTFLSLALLTLLVHSAVFELYRGLWLFWGISVLWGGLICLSLWKVWKYAFPE